jgi:hypothetical protein
VKIHGSALEYTVKPHPRFLPYAREGLEPARGVLVGSRHTAESLWARWRPGDSSSGRGSGPPGVDVARFRPAAPPSGARGARRAAGRSRPRRRTGRRARRSRATRAWRRAALAASTSSATGSSSSSAS